MGNTKGTPNSESVSTKLARITELASRMPGEALRTLAHHIDMTLMEQAYRQVRKDGATGIDGVEAAQYKAKLKENLSDLIDRFKSGRYKAPPVKRSWIAKADGTRRPLGIPTFEDKVLQKAVTMILEAVYEPEFLASSYGYRPGIGALHALRDLREELMKIGGGYVIEADIKSYFDTIRHEWLRAMLDRRVRDGVLRRQVDKWLAAGVWERGRVWYPEDGSPQGGVISPLLANIYLHEVLDQWIERDVKPLMRGKIRLIRYADDFVIVFEREADAKRVAEALPKRFAKYGLTLHPDKTRLLDFRRPPRQADSSATPSFDFLGFTHYWARSRRGAWVVKRKTIGKRLTRKLKEIRKWCREHRHDPIKEQAKRLESRMNGYYNYYGIPCNYRMLARFYRQVSRSWHYWLSRRSQRAYIAWDRYTEWLEVLLPPPKIVHEWV